MAAGTGITTASGDLGRAIGAFDFDLRLQRGRPLVRDRYNCVAPGAFTEAYGTTRLHEVGNLPRLVRELEEARTQITAARCVSIQPALADDNLADAPALGCGWRVSVG